MGGIELSVRFLLEVMTRGRLGTANEMWTCRSSKSDGRMSQLRLAAWRAQQPTGSAEEFEQGLRQLEQKTPGIQSTEF